MDENNPYEAGVAPVHMGMNTEDSVPPAPVDIGAVLQRSWKILTNNVGLVVGAALAPIAVVLPFMIPIFGLALAMDATDSEGVQLVLAVMLLGTYVALIPAVLIPVLGSVRICTRLARGQPASLGMIFGEVRRIPAVLLSGLAMILAVSVGYALCIVPGILLAFALQYAPYLIIDQERGPIASLTEAWALSWPHMLNLIIFEIVLSVGGVIAVFATCGLGYLVVIPFMLVARAVLYYALLGAAGRA